MESCTHFSPFIDTTKERPASGHRAAFFQHLSFSTLFEVCVALYVRAQRFRLDPGNNIFKYSID